LPINLAGQSDAATPRVSGLDISAKLSKAYFSPVFILIVAVSTLALYFGGIYGFQLYLQAEKNKQDADYETINTKYENMKGLELDLQKMSQKADIATMALDNHVNYYYLIKKITDKTPKDQIHIDGFQIFDDNNTIVLVGTSDMRVNHPRTYAALLDGLDTKKTIKVQDKEQTVTTKLFDSVTVNKIETIDKEDWINFQITAKYNKQAF